MTPKKTKWHATELPCLRDVVVEEKEQRFFWGELQSLPNNPHKLRNSYVIGHKEFVLIQIVYLRSRMTLDDYLFTHGSRIQKDDLSCD